MIYTWRTIAAKINHDVCLSIHDSGESEWRDIAPYFESSEESIIYDFFIQIWRITQNSVTESKNIV